MVAPTVNHMVRGRLHCSLCMNSVYCMATPLCFLVEVEAVVGGKRQQPAYFINCSITFTNCVPGRVQCTASLRDGKNTLVLLKCRRGRLRKSRPYRHTCPAIELYTYMWSATALEIMILYRPSRMCLCLCRVPLSADNKPIVSGTR
jgi:hypothetical protein